MNKKSLVSALCLLTLASCGKSNGSGSSNHTEDNGRQEMQEIEGTYKAIIRPMNHTISGWIPNGMLDISVSGDEVEVKSWMDDSASVTHIQSIHAGTKCPGVEHDTNKDGLIDFNEAMKVSKGVLLPLDGDLSSQDDGASVYPKGNFTYYQKASLADMMHDLSLEGRVVIVLGAAQNRTLPSTISTLPGQTPQTSIPIACGIIRRM